MPEIGPEPVRATTGFFEDGPVAWSLDGRHLVFERSTPREGASVLSGSGPWSRRIVRYDVSRRREEEVRGGGDGHSPSLSGDGELSGFVAASGRYEIRTRRGRLTGSLDLGEGLAVVTRPVLSPDGRWVAFLSSGRGPPEAGLFSGIWLKPVGGGNPVEVTGNGREYRSRVEWVSATGMLVYATIESGDGRSTRVDLIDIGAGLSGFFYSRNGESDIDVNFRHRFLVGAAEGPGRVELLSFDGRTTFESAAEEAVSGAWDSPDGRLVAIARFAPETRGINLFLIGVPAGFRAAAGGP